MEVRIGIVGLGRVGGAFLDGIVEAGIPSIRVVGVADPGGLAMGLTGQQQVPIYGDAMDLLQEHYQSLDILFDLTGRTEVRQQMRAFLAKHPSEVVIASEAIAHLVWQLLRAGRPLPEVHGQTGY